MPRKPLVVLDVTKLTRRELDNLQRDGFDPYQPVDTYRGPALPIMPDFSVMNGAYSAR